MPRKAILVCAFAFAGMSNCRTSDPFVDFDDLRPGLARKLAGCYNIEFVPLEAAGGETPHIDRLGGFELPTAVELTKTRRDNGCYVARLGPSNLQRLQSGWCLYDPDQITLGWGGTFTGVGLTLHRTENASVLVGTARESNDDPHPNDFWPIAVTLRRTKCERSAFHRR
jgi:hypothetical protein